jgi:ribonuclease P protein subunit POP4
MITPYNILRHELMGLSLEVVAARGKSLVGVSGEIVAESKSTLTVKTRDGGRKTLPKGGITVRLKLPERAVVSVDGRLLSGRPHERTKKKIRITFTK